MDIRRLSSCLGCWKKPESKYDSESRRKEGTTRGARKQRERAGNANLNRSVDEAEGLSK